MKGDYEIWKYPLPTRGRVDMSMPANSTLLSVQVQDDRPVLWAQVVPANVPHIRHFVVRLTGVPFDAKGRFVGTFQIGEHVGHVYDLGPE